MRFLLGPSVLTMVGYGVGVLDPGVACGLFCGALVGIGAPMTVATPGCAVPVAWKELP